jgi:AraC family transcriptional activator of pobA
MSGIELQRLTSTGDTTSLKLVVAEGNTLSEPIQHELYTIILQSGGTGVFQADFGRFPFRGPVILFATPLQTICVEGDPDHQAVLQFHGDFYCIEYHKQEVACNGVLFNNIYTDPTVVLTSEQFTFFDRILGDIGKELSDPQAADAVLTAYLQLFLAKATTIKTQSPTLPAERDEIMEQFRELIEAHFLALRRPAAYADLLHISPNTLTKRCRQYFRKTPTELIQERIVLEAKRGLHLSRRSVKEIAHELNFEDEHYFSRFFKKITGVTPLAFRQKTGISVVADLSSNNPE